MLTVMIIVANDYILYPYFSIFTDKVRVLDLRTNSGTHGDRVGWYILGERRQR